MKKTCLALSIAALAPQLACAQSSVTLAGIIDVGLNAVTNANGAHQYMMSSGVNNGSRFILRGQEDLGGGMSALFFLENGFNVNNGAIGQAEGLFATQTIRPVFAQGGPGCVAIGAASDSHKRDATRLQPAPARS